MFFVGRFVMSAGSTKIPMSVFALERPTEAEIEFPAVYGRPYLTRIEIGGIGIDP